MSTVEASVFRNPSSLVDQIVLEADGTFGGELASELGSKLDTSAYTEPGMVLITSDSVSAVSSLSINGCFTSTYDAYKLVWMGAASTDINLQIRLRASGSDASGATDYNYGALFSNVSGTTGNLFNSSGASLGIICQPATNAHMVSVEIAKPAVAVRTAMQTQSTVGYSTFGFITHVLANAYDGFTLSCNTGTITGNIYVYGYEK